MCMTFAEHVRSFGRDCDPAACVLPRLEKLLKNRMKRRNLFTSPPAYLGYDIPRWNAEGAFEDIIVDCYIFAVASRFEGLRNQLRVRWNIDGLIVRNVDNFLLERLRRRDPVGYAVFGNLEAAVADLVSSGQATVHELEKDRLRSMSIVRLDQEGAAVPTECDIATSSSSSGNTAARDWGQYSLPG